MAWEGKGGQLHCRWQLPSTIREEGECTVGNGPLPLQAISSRVWYLASRTGAVVDARALGELHVLAQTVMPSA